jgi:hypothetical protein
VDVVLIVVLAGVLLAAVGMGRLAWRFWHGNEELRAGGSMSRQMFRRARENRWRRYRRRLR